MTVTGHRAAGETPIRNTGRSTISATLKLTHNALGAEVRRGTYDVEADGSSQAKTFDAAEDGHGASGSPA